MGNPITKKFQVVIDQDGSRTVFDPNTADGQKQIKQSGPSGFVVTSDKEHSVEFTFNGGKKLRVATNPNGTLVSQTSLHTDETLPKAKQLDKTDPNKYVDTDSKAIVALSDAQMATLGLTTKDLGKEITITNNDNHKKVVAIFADTSGGNKKADHLEMNPIAAEALGISVNTATGATTSKDVANITVEPPLSTPTAPTTTMAAAKGNAKT